MQLLPRFPMLNGPEVSLAVRFLRSSFTAAAAGSKSADFNPSLCGFYGEIMCGFNTNRTRVIAFSLLRFSW